MKRHLADAASVGGQVTFRAMQQEDIQSICEIEQEAFPTPWTAEAFYNELVHNHFAHYTVMIHDGDIIGYGGLWLIIDEAHITNIALKSKARGKKLGERLLRYLMLKSAAFGAKRMTLEVRVSNHIAQNLYKKLGFQAEGIRRGYYSDNSEDAIIMWADLTAFTNAEISS